jgi:exocyst complex protein 7
MGRTVEPQHLIESGVYRPVTYDRPLSCTGPPTPPNYFPSLSTLLPLTSRMTSMLHPTPPTPKTASIIEPIFDDTIATFAEMRGEWISRSFSGMIARVDEVDEGGIWEGGRGNDKVRSLVGLWEGLTVITEVSDSTWIVQPAYMVQRV